MIFGLRDPIDRRKVGGVNPILANILSAKGNPHVLWPLVIALTLRVVVSALQIWLPDHPAQVAATKSMCDPIITAMVSYSTICAANSSPAEKTNQSKPNEKI